ncbi:MAG TPA: hypothetical protein DHW39_07615 [Erysipelotrichaceae bacterium]|nr:hypothetical protein [Erysipelotrichaceae bacterium]
MTELGAELLAKASESFANRIASDRKLKRILAKIRDGTSYFDANEYAVRLGELLSNALNESTDGLAFMSSEVAQELLEPLLTQDHELISDVIAQVQKNMNEMNGIGLNPLLPDVDTDRINGFIHKIASGDTLDEVRWMFGEPVINYSLSVVDKGIEKNAKATSKIGLKAYIVRKAEASGTKTIKRGNKTYRYTTPCRWCKDLEGRYDYEDVRDKGNDIYRRHESCRCQVTYENGTNQQDVWSKAEWTESQSAERQQAIDDAIARQKAEKERQKLRKEQRRRDVAYVASKLGYSDRGASIWINVNRRYIDKAGLDYMIDWQRNEDAKNGRRIRR